jgi:hypothetical protein
VLQHRLDDTVGAFAVLGDLLQVASQHHRNLLDLCALLFGQCGEARRGGFLQLAQQINRQSGEVVDEVERVLDLVRDAGGELAERRHLLRLDQVGLRGPQFAQGGFGGVACGADFLLAALSLCDVTVDQHEAATRHWVAADFDHPAIRPRALIAVGFAGTGDQLINLLNRIDTRPEVAARCKEAEVFLIGAMLFEKGVGQVQDILKLVVPCGQILRFVEHGDAVAHILEGDAEFLLASPKFFQEPRIFHRNHRLRGEVLQECNLLVCERASLLAVDDEVPEKRFILAQRHCEQGAGIAQFDQTAAHRVTGPIGLVVHNIRNVHHRLAMEQTAMRVVRSDRVRSSCQEFCKRWPHASERNRMDPLAIVGPKDPKRRLAQVQRLLQHRIEHRRKVAGRRIDHL